MITKEYITELLDVKQPMSSYTNRFSTSGILLRGARKFSGRDITTGHYVAGELNEDNFEEQTFHSNQFAGLINYLILLEQLGNIFKLTTRGLMTSNGIHRTLKYFSGLSDPQIFALRALRNSLAHNYGLATRNDEKDQRQIHKFIISRERSFEVVQLAEPKWCGDFSDKSDQSYTTIFLFDLIDLIENVYEKLKDAINEDFDLVAPTMSLYELETRFTIV